MWMASVFTGRLMAMLVSLVQRLAVTHHSVCIHKINWVKSRNVYGNNDSTTNIM